MKKGKKPTGFLNLADSRNKYGTMVRALGALYRAPRSPEYVAIACLVTCYIDAIAAHGGRATRGKFESFMRQNFKPLCDGLSREVGGRDGARAFYEHYRSAMVHTYFSADSRFAIAEEREMPGKYVAQVPAPGRTTQFIAVNIDRLYRDFV